MSQEIGKKATEVDEKLKIRENFEKAIHSEPVQKVTGFFQMVSAAIKEKADSIIKPQTTLSPESTGTATAPTGDKIGDNLSSSNSNNNPKEMDHSEELFNNAGGGSPKKPSGNQ